MEPEIELEEHDGRGRFVMRSEAGDAELTFSYSGESTLIATRTYVPDALRGRGIAQQLVTALIDHAHRKNLAITPACSYVASKMRENPEWAKLLHRTA